jgi:hypothetical protein
MITFSEMANLHISDLEIEVEAIKQSFCKTIKDFGPNSYKPFAVLFSDPDKKSFVITARNVSDAQDYYTAISEMLFAYSSTSAQAILFALDASKEISGTTYDVLEIYMASEHFCYIYSYPYTIGSDNEIQWLENMFDTHEIERLDKAYFNTADIQATMEIIEALYLHVHLRNQFFDPPKLKSFFDTNGFEYVDLTQEEKENSSSLSI